MQKGNKLVNNLDWTTIFIYILLVLMGWMNIYAAVYSEEHSSILDFSQRYGKQLIWILFAFIIATVIMLSDTRLYMVFSYIIYGLVIALLLGTLVLGKTVNASKSWLQIGSFGLQPAEFAKFATALALAKLMGPYGFKLNNIRSYLMVFVLIAVPAGIILLQNDTGSALVFGAFIFILYREGLPGWILAFLIFVVLLFIVTLIYNPVSIVIFLYILTLVIFILQTRKYKDSFRLTFGLVGMGLLMYLVSELFDYKIPTPYYFFIPVIIGIVIAFVYGLANRFRQAYIWAAFLTVAIAMSLSVDYVFHNVLDVHHQKRINDLLGIESDPLGWGYNVNQSKIAIGSGGFLGKGYLAGTQTKYNFVPEQSTDFIFCTVGEEWGFLGSTAVLGLFLYLLLRLIRIAERQREGFARVYGYGVVSVLFFHIVVNVGMTVGVFPVIGIPLPFFSYGGSSLWAFTILLFILLKFDSDRFGH
ncbi:MAG TPA: rod shape-determining protein RodA [Tenuifilaceae bacterium]|nr:rod shape-determining protein RodA [Tenuifilaceae bacterium]HPI43923.1 rod shape-determining protein RodA [Tenuifilaceae bacterium]HPN22707.1 rod shape-determining protein RodA [Tenuifilaceae bacterium]